MYEPGTVIREPSDALAIIMRREYIFWHQKPVHPGWASGWSIGLLASACRSGLIRHAKLTDYGREIISARTEQELAEVEKEFPL